MKGKKRDGRKRVRLSFLVSIQQMKGQYPSRLVLRSIKILENSRRMENSTQTEARHSFESVNSHTVSESEAGTKGIVCEDEIVGRAQDINPPSVRPRSYVRGYTNQPLEESAKENKATETEPRIFRLMEQAEYQRCVPGEVEE